MKTYNYILILIFLGLIAFINISYALPTDSGLGTITTSKQASAYRLLTGGGSTYTTLNFDYPFMNRLIKDENNRFWSFYPVNVSNQIKWGYSYSLDLLTWSSPAYIHAYFDDNEGGSENFWSVFTPEAGALNLDYDPSGQGVIYAGLVKNYREIPIVYSAISMARGIISGTTITWSAVETNPANVQSPAWGSGIAIDNTLNYNATSPMHGYRPLTFQYVFHLFTENNGWACCNPTYTNLLASTAISGAYGGTNIVSLSGHQFLYLLQNTTTLMFKVSAPSQTSWGNTYTLGTVDNVKTAFAITSNRSSLISYVVYINNTNLYFRTITATSSKTITFSGETLLKTGIGTNRPAIYFNSNTGDIHVFYAINNRIFVKQYEYLTSTWKDEYMLIDANNYGGLAGATTFNTGRDTGDFVLLSFRTVENSSKTLRIIWYKGIRENITSTLEGKLCGNIVGETNTTITEFPKLTSIMCIGDFQTGAIINRTGFVIHNYTNPFMSAWATLSIYMGDDGSVISNEHPLKLVWQKTYEVRNNTNNLVVEWYPNLFIPDHNFVAIAFSSTEDIGMNTTINTNTQYIISQYAPTTVSFLQASDYKVMMYAYWYRQNVTFAGDNSFSVQTSSFIPIPSQIQAFWISVGMPPATGGFIILITGVIMLSIVVLTKGVDEPEKVIGILGITAILCASAVNLIPVEIGIAVMIFVAAYFAMKIYSRMAGGSGE